MGFQNQASLEKYQAVAYEKRTASEHLTYRLLCLGQNLKTTIGRQQEQEWQEQLFGYQKEDIEHGYKILVTGEWFPSIKTFKQKCYENLQARLQRQKDKRERDEQNRLAKDPTAFTSGEAKAALRGEGALGRDWIAIMERFRSDRVEGDPGAIANEFADAMAKLFTTHHMTGYDRQEFITSKTRAIQTARKMKGGE